VLGLVTDGEFPTTLGATARKHFASVFRCHAGAESMGVFSLAAAGLKCTFHVKFCFLVVFLTELQIYQQMWE
jgi:hypothetical protein